MNELLMTFYITHKAIFLLKVVWLVDQDGPPQQISIDSNTGCEIESIIIEEVVKRHRQHISKSTIE